MTVIQRSEVQARSLEVHLQLLHRRSTDRLHYTRPFSPPAPYQGGTKEKETQGIKCGYMPVIPTWQAEAEDPEFKSSLGDTARACCSKTKCTLISDDAAVSLGQRVPQHKAQQQYASHASKHPKRARAIWGLPRTSNSWSSSTQISFSSSPLGLFHLSLDTLGESNEEKP